MGSSKAIHKLQTMTQVTMTKATTAVQSSDLHNFWSKIHG